MQIKALQLGDERFPATIIRLSPRRTSAAADELIFSATQERKEDGGGQGEGEKVAVGGRGQ